MSNLRVIYDNAADRATLTSSATQGVLGVSNLLSDIKSKVCRSTGTSLSVYATWPSAETIGCAAFAFTNLSPTTTARVRLTNESSVTNLFIYTDQFDNAAWLKNSKATIPATNSLAPDGTLTADTIQGDGTGAAYAYQQKTLVAAKTYTVSAFFKAGTYTGSINIHDFTDGGTVNLNLSTQAVSASGNYSSPVVTAYPNGWYRLSATVKPLSDGAKNVGLFNANTTGNILVWGAMLNEGGLSSYYPSVTTQGVRPTGYIDSWQSYAYDSGSVLFCPAPYKILHGLTFPQAASAYAYGGGKYACYWLPNKVNATGVAIDIVDPANLQGYVEVSRLICGDYWNPSVVDVSNTTLQVVDTSTHTRTDAGDLYTYVGTKHRKQALNLPSIEASSRKQLWDILFGNGMSKPIFISTYAGNADPGLEAAHMLYGKLSTTPIMSTPYYNFNAATIEIEEV